VISQFNDQGDLTGIIAEPNAHLTSESASSKTSVTAQKAVLHFDIQTEMVNGEPRNNSILHDAIASGNAVVESSPVPQPNKAPADTRILRSQQIVIAMKPGGREIASLTTNTPGEFEIKPNQPNRSHRWLDGETIRVVYGDANSVDSFHATKASTRTQKPLTAKERAGKDENSARPRPPALTWSDELDARFTPKSSDLASLVQKGNFRYQEGERHAIADSAHLDQLANRITLMNGARVWDETGTTSADKIVLHQQSGDMDATGNVASTHEPDQQKEGQTEGSLLDEHRPLQARADNMKTQDHNLKVTYEGRAVLWQGANRLQADLVDIDRAAHTIHATGHVISQSADRQPPDQSDTAAENGQVRLKNVSAAAANPPQSQPKPIIYTLVHAPKMVYRDDTRVAHYTGGVTLVHDKTTVESKELRAFLTKDGSNKAAGDNGGTSLDHAFADGDVKVTQAGSGRSRTGVAQHCEYYPKESKVVLNGGSAKMLDSRKGKTVGEQLTYWSNSDHVLVEGAAKTPVVSDMNRGR
jgi:lipopolysaccharide export system protein LptA